MVQTLFCLCLEHSGIRPLAACFGTFILQLVLVESLITNFFHLRTNEIKSAHNEEISLEINTYLARNIALALLCDIALFLLIKSLN